MSVAQWCARAFARCVLIRTPSVVCVLGSARGGDAVPVSRCCAAGRQTREFQAAMAAGWRVAPLGLLLLGVVLTWVGPVAAESALVTEVDHTTFDAFIAEHERVLFKFYAPVRLHELACERFLCVCVSHFNASSLVCGVCCRFMCLPRHMRSAVVLRVQKAEARARACGRVAR